MEQSEASVSNESNLRRDQISEASVSNEPNLRRDQILDVLQWDGAEMLASCLVPKVVSSK